MLRLNHAYINIYLLHWFTQNKLQLTVQYIQAFCATTWVLAGLLSGRHFAARGKTTDPTQPELLYHLNCPDCFVSFFFFFVWWVCLLAAKDTTPAQSSLQSQSPGAIMLTSLGPSLLRTLLQNCFHTSLLHKDPRKTSSHFSNMTVFLIHQRKSMIDIIWEKALCVHLQCVTAHLSDFSLNCCSDCSMFCPHWKQSCWLE